MGLDRLTLLRQEEDVDEDEEDDDEIPPWQQSGRECDCCGEGLPYCEEVFVLEIAQAANEGGQLFHDILRDDDDEYLYRPYMMHVGCWEELLDAIDEAMADQPPLEANDAILACSRCQSTIGTFEPFMTATFGEIAASNRFPSGIKSARFEPLSSMNPVCLYCVQHVTEDHLDEWEELLDDLPECPRPEGEHNDE